MNNENAYNDKLKSFQNKEGGSEKDFLTIEIQRLEKLVIEINKSNTELINNEDDDLITLRRKLKIATRKRELNDLIFDYTTKLNRFPKEEPENENVNIDLSDNKGTEKIIMLNELGLLDFLREKQPFNVSINSLASAISGFTGIKQKTVQSYINPIFSKEVNQKNNPLNSEKTVSKINQKLISIGYNKHN
jgi:hypothetical protein